MRPHFEAPPNGPGHAHDLIISGVTLLFWAAVVFGLVVLISWYVGRQTNHQAESSNQTTQDPIDIAKARYARGEITKAEFSQLKKDLA